MADDICYWRDMTFGKHFVKLLTKEKIYATVVFGEPIGPGMNRKQMAAALHKEVSAMAARSRRQPVVGPEVGNEELEPSLS